MMKKKYTFRPLSMLVMALCFIIAIMLTACQNGVSASSTGSGSGTSSSTTPTPSGNKATPSSNTTAGSTTSNTQKPTVPLVTIRMLDADHGWALTRQSVLRTVDGGAHWTQVEALHLGSMAPTADFMNVSYAWVAFHGVNDPLGTYKVIRTSDSGVTWQIATITLSNADQGQGVIDRPHFISTTNGWVTIGMDEGMQHSSLTVFHTSDGGATWTQLSSSFSQSSGLPMTADKTGISFANAQNGWVTAEYPGSPAWLYVTHNGGSTWQSQSLPLPNGQQAGTIVTTPPVFFGQNGIMPVELYYNSSNIDLYVTHDGGAHWTPTTLAGYNAVTFSALDLQHVWAIQSNGQGTGIYSTTDGGASWHAIGNAPQMVRELSFVDPQDGWAIGASTSVPQLYHTINGGANWTQINYSIS